MAGQEDVRRIAMALPDVTEGTDRFAFSVRRGSRDKGFAWVWLERTEPRSARVPNPDVLAVRVVDEDDKRALIESDPEVFFTEPHYNGYPAVLVRLPNIDLARLEELLTDGWRCQAPKGLVRQFEEGEGSMP